ncbi:hypothetical protein P9112_007259 [Eukaryota sp. TZLM1-RC]
MYMISALISYASTSAGSLMTNFAVPYLTDWGECNSNNSTWSSNCFHAYLVFLSIYAVLVIILTLVGLSGQGLIQSAFTVYRYLVLIICIITVTIAIFMKPFPVSISPHVQTVPDWQFQNLGVLIPTLFFANIGHHSLPGLVAPLNNKKKIRKALRSVVILLTVTYILLCTTSVLYFGKDTGELLSLMWKSYPWGYDTTPWWGSVVRQLVVLFVPIVCLSAFPINAITLGNNIYESVCPPHKREYMAESRMKKIRVFCLLAFSIPALAIAVFARKLSTILSFGGLTGFFIALAIPAMLHLSSRERCISLWNSKITGKNRFSSFFSKPIFAYLIIYIAIVASVVTANSLIRDIFFV